MNTNKQLVKAVFYLLGTIMSAWHLQLFWKGYMAVSNQGLYLAILALLTGPAATPLIFIVAAFKPNISSTVLKVTIPISLAALAFGHPEPFQALMFIVCISCAQIILVSTSLLGAPAKPSSDTDSQLEN